MSAEDELVEVIWRADENGPNAPTSERIAAAIRAHWRLVPIGVECGHDWQPVPADMWPPVQTCSTCGWQRPA